MINAKKTNFMKSKETEPYEFQWLNEILFQESLEKIMTSTIIDKKICTIGYMVDNNVSENEANIKFDNSILKIDLSRIHKNYKISKNPYYLYGSLKKRGNEVILFVNFYRILGDDFSFDTYKTCINYQRHISFSCNITK